MTDDLKTGRDLDELVATKVMGWRRPDPKHGREGTWVDVAGDFMAEAECGTEYGSDDGPCPGDCDSDCVRFRPSNSGDDAREVIRSLKKRGIKLTVEDPEPVNICRAALKAVGETR